MTDTLDALLAGGAKTAKFENIGDSVTGKITNVQVRQATEFGTGKPLTWPDGNPRQQVVITLATSLREDADDDGERSVYIKAWAQPKKALQAAAQAAGGSPAVGDTFTATFTGFGPKSPQGGFPPKEYAYKIVKANPADAVLAAGTTTAPATPAGSATTTASPGIDPVKAASVTKLINLSQSNEDIVKMVDGVTVEQVEALRLQAAAASSQGF